MPEAAPKTKDTPENVAPKESTEDNDAFQIIIAIMIALASLMGAMMAWQADMLGGPAAVANRAGMQAIHNKVTANFINQAELYKNYRAYVNYTLHNELQRQIKADLAYTPLGEVPHLKRQQAQSSDLAAMSQLFFPQRYLERDGSYNAERQLGESWAYARQSIDLDAQSHFEEASQEQDKIFSINIMIFILTISFLFYTFAEGMHPTRKWLRYAIALSGFLFLLNSVTRFAAILY